MSSTSQQRTPASYRIADAVSGILLCVMIVFSPWAFGTTQPWAIWTMNAGGYLLGLGLIVKWSIRWKTGYEPARWGEAKAKWFTVSLAVLTVLILGWCLTSAVNARAYYLPGEARFEYQEKFVAWLPHSYSARWTWNYFFNYLAMAFSFWAARDWILGKTRRERHLGWEKEEGRNKGKRERGGEHVEFENANEGGIPDRLRILLWVLCINGGVLALEGILQRLDGTNKLLWLVQPLINNTAEAQFGPYAYRSNAAQYLNIVWPLCLGFWWVQRERARLTRRTSARAGGSPHILLLPLAILMAAAPIVSTSRGGALVSLGGLLCSMIILIVANRGKWWLHLTTLAVFLSAIALGVYLGWDTLRPRLLNLFADDMSGRKEIYENTSGMVEEYGWFGSGPGSFRSLYQFYRKTPDQKWQAFLHDDLRETVITFGKAGSAFLCAALLLGWSGWLWRGGIPVRWVFGASLWVALGGCLVHAKYDFPLQVYSVLFLFLTLCAISITISRSR